MIMTHSGGTDGTGRIARRYDYLQFHRAPLAAPFLTGTARSDMVEIDLDEETDRWQWRCPAGHRSWEPTNYHFWCAQCARGNDPKAEPEFQKLRNVRTEETVPRDEVELVRGSDSYKSLRGGKA